MPGTQPTNTPTTKLAGNSSDQIQSNILGSADESYRDVQQQLKNAKPIVQPKIKLPWQRINFSKIGKFFTLILFILVLGLTTLCIYLLTGGTPTINIQQTNSSSSSSISSSSASTTSSDGSSSSSSSSTTSSGLTSTNVIIFVAGKFTGSDNMDTVEGLPAGTVIYSNNYYAVPVVADTNIKTPDAVNTALSYLTLKTDNYVYADPDGRLLNMFDQTNLSGLTLTYTKTDTNVSVDIALQNPQSISSDVVTKLKMQLERTIGYYTPYFEISLNGKLTDYTNWGK